MERKAPDAVGRVRSGGGFDLIAQSNALTDLEQIIGLLERCAGRRSIAPVLHDIREVQRLLDYYSFRTPQLADLFAEQLQGRYRYEIFGLYGSAGLLGRRPESSYLFLQQLLGQLARVAAARLCCEGVLSLSHAQLLESDGLLLQVLEKELA